MTAYVSMLDLHHFSSLPVQMGGAWSWALLLWVFVLVPVLDVCVGVCTANNSRAQYKAMSNATAYRVSTLAFPIAQIVLLLCTAAYVSSHSLSTAELVGICASVGVYTGGTCWFHR